MGPGQVLHMKVENVAKVLKNGAKLAKIYWKITKTEKSLKIEAKSERLLKIEFKVHEVM